MLSPELLETAGDAVAAVYNDIEAKMLTHLVSSLIYIDRLDQQTITELNLLAQSHTEQLRGYIEAEAEVIDEKVRETAERLLRASDEDDVRRVGEGSASWPQQVEATVEGVARILARDNLKMVEGAKQAFLSASVEAVTRVNTGTMTTERALHSAVRKLERNGIPIITYQNSKTGTVTVENKVDVAVRRHIRTQIAQDGARMTMDRIQANDVTLVEVSSHEDSRESHAVWQGQVYSLKGDIEIDGKRYRDFFEATGYGSVDGLMGANCRHSFGPYRHGAPRAYEQDPKHPSGLSGAEIYELEQTQRYLERRIREAKREVRGAQQVYEKLGDLESRSALLKAQGKLKDSQSAMRDLIREANAKAKPGTTVLTRKPNREWAGDMPKGTTVKASGRKLDEFLGGEGVRAQVKAKGLSVAKVRASIKAQLQGKGGDTADFSSLSASDQRGMLRRALDTLSGAAKAKGGKHAATPQRYVQALRDAGLQDAHADGIAAIVAACKSAAARTAFERALPDLGFDSTTARHGTAFYSISTHRLTLNMEDTASGFAVRPDKAPFQTFFHEAGHYIDHLLGSFKTGTVRNGRRIMENMSGIAHQSGMASVTRGEVRALLNEIKKRDGGTMDDARRTLTRELRGIPDEEIGGLADIVHGATSGKCGWGHKVSYWKDSKDYGLATETFAHFYETTMANPAALETLKRYLPETYNLYTSIIGGA
jgi:hypothetical protein